MESQVEDLWISSNAMKYQVATDRRVNTEESIWNVEEHNQNISYPEGMKPEDAQKQLQQIRQEREASTGYMSFLEKFWELQVRMLKANRELQQDHAFASRPFNWPIMRRGVAYWIDKTSNAQIFCIGNPVIWWSGTIAIFGYCSLLCLYLLRRRRAMYDLSLGQWQLFVFTFVLLIGGYILHFVPFFTMERTLFIHHYLPALLFKLLAIPMLADHIQHYIFVDFPILQKMFAGICMVYALLVLIVFRHFSPFTYGSPALSAVEVARRKWISTWDFLSHPNT